MPINQPNRGKCHQILTKSDLIINNWLGFGWKIYLLS